MRYPRFLAVNVVAAASFVSLIAGITFAFGSNLDAALRFFQIYRWVALALLRAVGAIFLYRYHERKKDVHNNLALKLIIGAAIAVTAAALLVHYAGHLISAITGA